jgi:hypothetical protein
MPPQHYILTTLADILVGGESTFQQRERVKQLSAGAFGRMVIHPKVCKKDANGWIPLVYEGDEARGGPNGRLHRSLMLVNPETEVRLHDAAHLTNAEGETRSIQQRSHYYETLIYSLKLRAV